MKHNDDILIDRFLRRELTEEEQKEFERRLEEEEEFRLRVEEMEEISMGIRSSVLKEKRNLLLKFEEEVSAEESNSSESSGKNKVLSNRRVNIRRMQWLGAAAVITLISILFWPKNEIIGPLPEYAYLFEEGEFEKTIEHQTFRSGNDSLSADKIIAYRLYANQNFELAIPKLKKLWEEEQDSIAYKYLGYSYIWTRNPKGNEILSKFK